MINNIKDLVLIYSKNEINNYGLRTIIAKKLGLTRSAVSQWFRKNRIPKKHLLKLNEIHSNLK